MKTPGGARAETAPSGAEELKTPGGAAEEQSGTLEGIAVEIAVLKFGLVVDSDFLLV